MTDTTYRFIEDPGHGWLEVPVAELRRLGLLAKISPYSYRRNAMAYLEEDCDFALFAAAKSAAGEPLAYTRHYQDPTPVRNYRSFYV